MKRIFKIIPALLVFVGIAIALFSVGSDDYSIMHGNGAQDNALTTALGGIALALVGAFLSKIRRSAK